MKYQCEICGNAFDYESDCKYHIESHKYSDYYGKCLRFDVNRYYIPGGFILMDDGERMIVGIEISLTSEGCKMYPSHFPEDSVKKMDVVKLDDIWDSLRGQLIVHLNELREETYQEWMNRREKK